jgi:hypothetical protein
LSDEDCLQHGYGDGLRLCLTFMITHIFKTNLDVNTGSRGYKEEARAVLLSLRPVGHDVNKELQELEVNTRDLINPW